MAEPKSLPAAVRQSKRGENRKHEIARRVCAAAEKRVAAGTPFASLSIEQLVADAEVPRSTFYVYFRDKAAVIRTVLDELAAFSVATMFPADAATELTRERLRASLVAGVQFYRERQSTFRMLADAAVSDVETAATYRATVDKVIDAVSQAFAQRRRSRRASQADRALASSLIWMLERTLYHELRASSEAQVNALVTTFETVFWRVFTGVA